MYNSTLYVFYASYIICCKDTKNFVNHQIIRQEIIITELIEKFFGWQKLEKVAKAYIEHINLLIYRMLTYVPLLCKGT